jgi:hypothetical protein
MAVLEQQQPAFVDRAGLDRAFAGRLALRKATNRGSSNSTAMSTSPQA